jgi:single-stranded-DNA-specific exonuclease
MTAYDLLSTDDLQAATEYAHELQELNTKRQALTREAQERARALTRLDGDRVQIPSVIFAIDAGFPQGIVGLVAGRLTEEFYRPAIILHRGEHESHGSCRSIVELNITEALDRCADLLLRHGGHAQAAGFAIANDNLPNFEAQITEIITEGLEGKDLRPQLEIDAEVLLRQLDMRLYDDLRRLEPCGAEYPAPVLCSRALHVTECRTVGEDSAHLKLKVTDGKFDMEAIGFRLANRAEVIRRATAVDVAYQLDINEWNGTRRLQLKVQDVRETSG